MSDLSEGRARRNAALRLNVHFMGTSPSSEIRFERKINGMAIGLYAYGVIQAGGLDEPPAVVGLDPRHPVLLVRVGELAALVSEVEISEFEGEQLQSNLARPEWLEEKVRAHEGVLEDVMERTTVVPMRFGSIFSTPDSLVALLSDRREHLSDCLHRVRGKAEWGVRVHYEPDVVDMFATIATQQETERDHLVTKRKQLRSVVEAPESIRKTAKEVHSRLERAADGAAISLSAEPANRNLILNATYLIAEENRRGFMETVQQLKEEHAGKYTFEVTGPWPPYSFTSVDPGDPTPAP